MSKDRYTRLDADRLFDLFPDFDRAAGAFGDDDHEMGIAGKPGGLNSLDHILLEVFLMLRDENGRSAYGDAHIQRQETRVSAHDLHDRAALVGLHGIPQLVDAVDGGVAGGVKADGIVRAAQIVVNGSRDPDHRDAEPRQFQCPAERSVTANGNYAVQAKHFAGHDGPLPSLFGHEIFTAGGIQDRPSAGQDMSHTGAVQFHKIGVNQPLPASSDPDAFNSAGQRRTHNRPHRGVHSRGVTAAGQYTDSFDIHVCSSCFNVVFLP